RAEAREAMFEDSKRLALDELLAERLSKYIGAGADQRLATMFVVDRHGTILGIAYDNPVSRERNSAARNFAYRTYFHGGQEDFEPPEQDDPVVDAKPLAATHLSAAFQSTASGLWKVAISTPVDLDESDGRDADAVFVVTINLGDFKLLQNEQTDNQVAVLVEARQGDLRGTVLQHPWMDSQQASSEKMLGAKFQISNEVMDRLTKGGNVDYLDPLAAAEGGDAYAGDWIAAMQPIALPERSQAAQTGLLVMVQYRLAKVFAPVGEMRNSLLREGAWAILSVLLITLMMWYFVLKATDRKQVAEDEPESQPHSGLTETIAKT
ncbi:MAG: serine/threonine protein kinase, partial [Planctomycetota bacterium]